ncbi:MAG TPA: PP2C family protein-serine/threonine phosphatase [Verrucomicrobiae bacterium]|nr:PP2C family protein-serine/threonine phosphatase [Verrucomicrobiae bacterium]
MSYQNHLDILSRLDSAYVPSLSTAARCGLDFYGESRAVRHAGGDFFDFVPLESGMSISVGEVSGTGLGGGIFRSGVQSLLRSFVHQCAREIASVIRELNHIVWESSSGDFSASVFCAHIDPVSGEMRYVNAAHEPALLIRRRTGRIHRLESTGAILGLRSHAVYGQRTLPLEPRDLLIVPSDGVTDARSSDGREFREAGVLNVVEQFPDVRSAGLTREILEAVERHAGRQLQSDDRTVVVVRFKGALAQTEAVEEEEESLALAAA